MRDGEPVYYLATVQGGSGKRRRAVVAFTGNGGAPGSKQDDRADAGQGWRLVEPVSMMPKVGFRDVAACALAVLLMLTPFALVVWLVWLVVTVL